MEPPRKRQRRSPPPSTKDNKTTNQTPSKTIDAQGINPTQKVMSDTGFQPDREAEVGILHFVSATNPGFTGTLKQRYTDFLVNEIAPDGSVVHLTNDQAPRHPVNTNQWYNGQAYSKDEDKASSSAQRDRASTSTSDPALIKTEDAEATTTKEAVSDPTSIVSNPNGAPSADDASSESSQTVYVIAPGDHELLETYFGPDLKNQIIALHDKIIAKPGAKASSFGSLSTAPITDRAQRGRLHHDIRRIFAGHFETVVNKNDDTITFTAVPPRKPQPDGRQKAPNPRSRNIPNQPKGKLGWEELGGEHLHFSLYKENKDTMEVISFLARFLRVKPKDFSFAGTKDRRAVTVQRVSVWRKNAQELARVNRELRMARIGDFKHEKQRLELGENDGNQFTITLRDCQFREDDTTGLSPAERVSLGNDVVAKAVEHLQNHGFISYYGLQRFGTFGIGTDEVGKRILMGDFTGAIDAILTFNEESLHAALNPDSSTVHDRIGRDDVARAHAIHLFRTGNGRTAMETIPSKFTAEKAIIQHLSSNQKGSDHLGALLVINRNLRTMYVHAYQSLVWNMVASERWARHGDKVIAGDLVIVDVQAAKDEENQDDVDENGEVIIRPAVDDFAVTRDDIFERARRLTHEEAESGKYTIFDIVLPTPGYDVEYPGNDIGDFYMEFMQSKRGGGINPGDMRRAQKDFSLSGNYRKLIGRVGNATFEIKTYIDENEQLVETDLEKLNKSRPQGDITYKENIPPNRETGTGQNWGEKRGNDRNTRGGGRNNRFDNQRAERRLDRNQERVAQPDRPARDPRLNAWMNLPEKLAADDKATIKAIELAKLTEPTVNPNDIKQPIYKETYIETSVDDEGRRTGVRTTKYIRADGQEVSKEEAEATPETTSKPADTNDYVSSKSMPPPPRPGLGAGLVAGLDSAMELDTAEQSAQVVDTPATSNVMDIDNVLTTPTQSEVPASTFKGFHKKNNSIPSIASSSDSEGGGVKLPPGYIYSPLNKGSPSSSSPLNPTASDFISSGSSAGGSQPSASPRLNPAALDYSPSTPVEGSAKSTSPRLSPTASEFVPSASTGKIFETKGPSNAQIVPAEDVSAHTKTTQEVNKIPEHVKIAVIIKFVLGTSQYATVALRELMKLGGVKTYKPDFSGGR